MSNNDPQSVIRDRITTLEEECAKLRDRLDTAMLPSAPTAETQPAQPAKSNIRARLDALIDQVRDVQQRLEI